MHVGVAKLRARLSRYLSRAECGRRKALPSHLTGAGHVGEGIAAGWIDAGDGRAPAAPTRRFRAALTVQAMMDEDRGA